MWENTERNKFRMVTIAKKKVLMVEDDESLRTVMKLFFEREGYYVVAVETAEEGLKELAVLEYDIIISDYMLPGMDGLEFLQAIQKAPVRSSKVLTTAFSSHEVMARAKELGAAFCIEKPLTAEKIEACLAHFSGSGK